MKRAAALIVLTFAGASPVLAADWGKVADPKVCDAASVQSQIHYYDKCQAEITKMVVACLANPAMEKKLTAAGYTKGAATVPSAATEACEAAALEKMKEQIAEGDVEKAVLPKATWKNPAVEKMVAATFKSDYKDGEKLLKVILNPDKPAWEVERNGVGVVIKRSVYATVVYQKGEKCTMHSTYWVQPHNGKAFAGPLEEHGAGAEVNSGIICSKVK